jgi:hypothetical protein
VAVNREWRRFGGRSSRDAGLAELAPRGAFFVIRVIRVIRGRRNVSPITGLRGEAFAAGAMRDGIRICNFKAAFLQVVAKIED